MFSITPCTTRDGNVLNRKHESGALKLLKLPQGADFVSFRFRRARAADRRSAVAGGQGSDGRLHLCRRRYRRVHRPTPPGLPKARAGRLAGRRRLVHDEPHRLDG